MVRWCQTSAIHTEISFDLLEGDGVQEDGRGAIDVVSLMATAPAYEGFLATNGLEIVSQDGIAMETQAIREELRLARKAPRATRRAMAKATELQSTYLNCLFCSRAVVSLLSCCSECAHALLLVVV